MIRKSIPVILITGYLGAGKTTFMNELLRQEQRKVAVIVNDMGSINVDAGLLKQSNSTEMQMVELSNGCICCTLRDEFMDKIGEIACTAGIEAIFVEASGISDPASVAEAFLAAEQSGESGKAYLSSVVTVVDADRIWNEFFDSLRAGSAQDETDPDIINLVIDQIEFCDTIILNKCDLLGSAQTEEVIRMIRKLQPEARIIQAVRGKVNAGRVIRKERFDYEKTAESSVIQKTLRRKTERKEDDNECGVTSFVYECRQPFERERLTGFIEEEFPEEIIRTKGYVWFTDDPTHVYLMETAGRNASLTEYSNWVAAFDETEKEQVCSAYPEILEDWDEEYGDRMNQLVFIGKGYDREEICRKLDACLE